MKGSSNKCSICASPLKSELDRLLLADIDLHQIVTWASNNGQEVSVSALSRHQRNHLKLNEVWNAAKTTGTRELDIFDEMADAMTFEQFSSSISSSLAALLLRQVEIVAALQIAYSKGDGESPIGDIKSLKALADCASVLMSYRLVNDIPSAIESLTRQGYRVVDPVAAPTGAQVNGNSFAEFQRHKAESN